MEVNRQLLINQLQTDEGLRHFPYKDTVGKLSIGYGRNLDDVGIDTDEALYLLHNDVDVALSHLYQKLPWVKEKPEPVQRALANMVFNMGIESVLKFNTTLALIQADKFAEAAQNLTKSKWYSQVGARAERVCELLASG